MNVLELNDTGLLLSDGARIIDESPGYAVHADGQLWVGRAAFERARLNPRSLHHRYWRQLDQQALDRPIPGVRSAADLVFAQLQAIAQALDAQSCVLAVPGNFDKAQLGLLLGVAGAAGLKAVGLADAAVAACTQTASAGRVLHLDLQLHGFVASVLEGGETVSRLCVESLSKSGLVALHDAFAGAITAAFVKQTRFDPMHNARTEQALYDALPAFLARAENDDAIELDVGAQQHRAHVSAEALRSAAAPIYDEVLQGLSALARKYDVQQLMLSHRIGALPMLPRQLQSTLAMPLENLDVLNTARGVLENASAIVSEDESLAFVTRLPGIARKAADAPTLLNQAPLQAASHVLIGARAVALPKQAGAALELAGLSDGNSAPLTKSAGRIVYENHQHCLQAPLAAEASVNGKPAPEHMALKLGDRIRVCGQELCLIAVESSG